MIVAEDLPFLRKKYSEIGVSRFIELPIKNHDMASLCAGLKTQGSDYYLSYSDEFTHDMPDNVKSQMPYLREHLLEQIIEIRDDIARINIPETADKIKENAHALKSSALSLGYFRLAALASQIEHSLEIRSFEDSSSNWQIIVKCFDEAANSYSSLKSEA